MYILYLFSFIVNIIIETYPHDLEKSQKFSVEYSLRDINKPIGVSSYEVSNILPKDIMEALPTEEDLNLHIDISENEEDN